MSPELITFLTVLVSTAGACYIAHVNARNQRRHWEHLERIEPDPVQLAKKLLQAAPTKHPSSGAMVLVLIACTTSGFGLLRVGGSAIAQARPRCSPVDCRPPGRCVQGSCEADAKPGPQSDVPLPAWFEHEPGGDPFARLLSPTGVPLE